MAASDLASVAVVDPDALPGVPAASTAEPGHMDPAIFAFRIRGLAAATYTPFAADGSVDLSVVSRDAAFLSRNGVSYAFVNGTSGESMSLSTAERKALVEAWVEAGRRVDPPVRVIAHIGCNALPEAKEMAAHAAAAGAVAIAAMAPTFFKAAKSADLALWLQEVCAAAPTLPFYYYHFPVITGVSTDPVELLDRVEELRIPNFRGFKFTDFNTHLYEMAVRYAGGRYDAAYGRDEALLSGLACGASGHIGNGFCYMAGVYHRLRKAFFRGDLATARLEQARSCDAVKIMLDPKFGGNSLVVSKAMHVLRGIPVGPPRLPLRGLSEERMAELRRDLEAIGFFEWCDE